MFNSVLDTIGNTPLIRLSKASELTGCDIYGKQSFSIRASRSRTVRRLQLSAMRKNAGFCGPEA